MRIRVRSAYTPEELAEIYAKPHEHAPHKDHRLRVSHTINMANQLMVNEANDKQYGFSVADLACGDGFIAKSLCREPILGDYAPGYPICGPIEQTIEQIPHVRLFVFTEIMEHLDDPDKVLRQIHAKADCLILSTPISEDPETAHVEHYWSWSMQDVADMLWANGWRAIIYGSDIMPGASFQYWACWHIKRSGRVLSAAQRSGL